MNPPVDVRATQTIDHDRGLGTAYERWCFYQLLGRWAREYEVDSALEGPLDGMAGVSGVHLVGLARAGCRVTSAVLTAESARVARAVYDGSAGDLADEGRRIDVRVLCDPMRAADELPVSDLVLAYHALPFLEDWRGYLRRLAKLARKALVVTVCNPDNWGVTAIRLARRLRGLPDTPPPATWRTEVLAPELWGLGRVREHVYFDSPWWPDLQVSPGQALRDRARQLVRQHRAELRFTAEAHGAQLAARFVYGPAKWPYFGGQGWTEELQPALLRHPAFEGVGPPLARRVAHLHAFVVDVRPRTPQARRRLVPVR